MKKNFRTEEQLKEEFERRTRFHTEELALGQDETSQQIARFLALADMESGVKGKMAPINPTQNETSQLVENLAKIDRDGLLRTLDRIYKKR